MDPTETARRYFDEYALFTSSARQDRLAYGGLGTSALDAVADAARRGDEGAWPILVALVNAAPDDAALAFVAAGPLEALVRGHTATFLDRLVERARAEPRFRQALKDVWGWEEVDGDARRRLFDAMGVPDWEASVPVEHAKDGEFRGYPRRG